MQCGNLALANEPYEPLTLDRELDPISTIAPELLQDT